MQTKPVLLILIILLLWLSNCQSRQLIPTSTASIFPTITNIPRWRLFEKALSKEIVDTDDGLCEWVILGMKNNEIYVYALCKIRGPIGTAGSVPAVIYLKENGEIENVIKPRDGYDYGKDIKALFPPDIQTRISNRETKGLISIEHLVQRLQQGGPPLIVLSGTPQP
jgi:hypothetical protein